MQSSEHTTDDIDDIYDIDALAIFSVHVHHGNRTESINTPRSLSFGLFIEPPREREGPDWNESAKPSHASKLVPRLRPPHCE